MISKDRLVKNGSAGKALKVVLYKKGEPESDPLKFNSLAGCVEYFRSIGVVTSSYSIKSCIKSGKELHGYSVRWDEDQSTVHGRAHVITVKDLDTGVVNTYNSIREAAREKGV